LDKSSLYTITKLSQIVKEVGAQLLELRAQKKFDGAWKDGHFKAMADDYTHKLLVQKLTQLDESIPVASEEDYKLLEHERPEKYWLIDPIDGTLSFVNGFPGFVTQVALIQNNTPILAAINAPALDLLYTAEKNNGAYCNNKKIHVNKSEKLQTLIDNYPEPRGIAKDAYKNFNFSSYVECGSISLKICKIADGTADLFLKDVPIRDWDTGAPQLVLEEAGGNIKTFDGKPFAYTGNYEHKGVVATTSARHAQNIITHYSL
jgi:3'(2'), 5'-bisphosphate nucleotidase